MVQVLIQQLKEKPHKAKGISSNSSLLMVVERGPYESPTYVTGTLN